MWSPLNPNLVFTGGEDSTVFGWTIDSQTEKLPVKKSPPKKFASKNIKEAKEMSPPRSSEASDLLFLLETKRRELTLEPDTLNRSDLSDSRDTSDLKSKYTGLSTKVIDVVFLTV